MRIRVEQPDTQRLTLRMKRVGNHPVQPLEKRMAKRFAAILRPITRVDTGALKASVGATGRVAGYGVRRRQNPAKQRASWNRERYDQARVQFEREVPQMLEQEARRMAREWSGG